MNSKRRSGTLLQALALVILSVASTVLSAAATEPTSAAPARTVTRDAEPDDSPRNSSSGSGREIRLQSLPVPRMPDIPASTADNEALITSEILILSANLEQADASRQALEGLGLRIRKRLILDGLDSVLSIYRVPDDQQPDRLLQQIKQTWPALIVDFNRFYFLQNSAGREYAQPLIGLRPALDNGAGIHIAMLDAKVDTNHAALRDSLLEVVDITGDNTEPSRHGTAVASLFVGRDVVNGATPSARLLAVNIFAPAASGELRTRTDWWLEGLNRILTGEQRPVVINMSFGGEPSPVASAALQRTLKTGVMLVAAAGNGGPRSHAMFPANLPGVIGVTAIDIDKAISRQAPRDETIRLAAPGVDIWAADLNDKGYYASGSSFAAPWVSAVVALAKQQGQALDNVMQQAEDLGAPGRDPVFGYGLVRWPSH